LSEQLRDALAYYGLQLDMRFIRSHGENFLGLDLARDPPEARQQ
jgi:hypothetical protein